jgi:amidase
MPSWRQTSSAGGTDPLEDLFATHNALAVAELVRGRQIGARELLHATLARLRETNGRLNAITDFYAGELLERSVVAAGDGPFQGIPFVVKQLMADCAGTPTTVGSRFFAREPVAANDSAAVARMRRAGLVIVGRSNTSEFGLAPTTEPAFGGATVNPWRADLSPGGSSGGSAAVVAARALPMAHATDGGGSIRIPASLCGLFGLKPSRGRISLAPIGETLAGAGAQLCVSISVRDSAALLDALAGGEAGDPYRAPETEGSFLDATKRGPGKLRIAFLRKPVGWEAMDPALVAAVECTAKRLEALGHQVEEATPAYDAAAAGEAFGTVMCAVGERAHGWKSGALRGGARADGGLHVRLQCRRRAGHVGAAGVDGRRPADRHAFRCRLRRRSHFVVTGRPARGGASVVRSAASGVK